MPYFIKKVKDGFKVCKTSDPSKCFSNEGIPHDNAVKQMKAIGISEARKGGVMTHRLRFLKKNKLEDKPYSLDELSDISGYDVNILKDVYDRGIGAYKTNPQSVRMKGTFKKGVNAPMSMKLSKEQWAYARLYSFLDNGKHDRDLRKLGGELSDSDSESDSNSDSSSELSSDSESDVEGSGTKSFFDQLNDLGINKEDYLKEMKKKAKNSGYKSANLSWCLDDVHKLQYLSPEGVKKFGRVGYKDFYIYQQLEKKGEVPVGYANTMKNRFRKSHGEITKKHNLNKYSPNELSINILW